MTNMRFPLLPIFCILVLNACSSTPSKEELEKIIGRENLLNKVDCRELPANSFVFTPQIELNNFAQMIATLTKSEFNYNAFTSEDMKLLNESLQANLFTWKKPLNEADIELKSTQNTGDLNNIYWNQVLNSSVKGFYFLSPKYQYYIKPYICIKEIQSLAGDVMFKAGGKYPIFSDNKDFKSNNKVYRVYNATIEIRITINFVDLSEIVNSSKMIGHSFNTTALIYTDRNLK